MEYKNPACRVKRLLLVISLMIASALSANSQELSVKSFQKLDNDLTARVTDSRTDQNGEKAALIKIVTTQTDFTFDGGIMGIVDSKQAIGEIWLWVPRGLKRVTILHQELGVLRNYYFPEKIDAATTYELVLNSGKVAAEQIAAEEKIKEAEKEQKFQYFAIRYTPAEADIDLYIDETNYFQGTNGYVSARLAHGTHTYRIASQKYHPTAGTIEVSDDKSDINVELKSMCGIARITSSPETGAEVYYEGRLIGTTPFITEELLRGEHQFTIKSQYYLPSTTKILINEGERSEANVRLTANYSNIIVAADKDYDIYINNEFKALRSATLRMVPGSYLFEARKDGKTKYITRETIVANSDKTILLNNKLPKPQYGSININTNTPNAKVYIDGIDYGKTPCLIENILIGTHSIKIEKENYAIYNETITLAEKQTLTRVISLEAVAAAPIISQNKINGNEKESSTTPAAAPAAAPAATTTPATTTPAAAPAATTTTTAAAPTTTPAAAPATTTTRTGPYIFTKQMYEAFRKPAKLVLYEQYTQLEPGVFSGSTKLESIELPESLTEIGKDAFLDCKNLSSVQFPSSLTVIGEAAFSKCRSLYAINLPNQLNEIGFRAFSYCIALSSISIPNSVTIINGGAFTGCESLNSVELSQNLISLGTEAFLDCKRLYNIILPANLKSIGSKCFKNCISIYNFTIPEGISVIEEQTFMGCTNMVAITVPSSVSVIQKEAFKDCSKLTTVTIPEGVTVIEEGTFTNCESLVAISLPSTITTINGNPFKNCANLTSINIPQNLTSIQSGIFEYRAKIQIMVRYDHPLYPKLKQEYREKVIGYQ